MGADDHVGQVVLGDRAALLEVLMTLPVGEPQAGDQALDGAGGPGQSFLLAHDREPHDAVAREDVEDLAHRCLLCELRIDVEPHAPAQR